MLLALVAGSAHAEYACEGPFESGNWFVKPKIGVAPSIFASRRARQQFVVPRAAQDQAVCNTQGNCGTCDGQGGGAPVCPATCNINNFANTLQEGPCLPKFSDMFRQGVLHVGVELGYNVCDRSPWFLEFVYNRASGQCIPQCGEYITNAATAGCTADCNTDCKTSCADSCCPTGDTLSNICGIQDNYDDYTAYGGYLGARYFTDRFWCDSTSFWFGYKVGILHRNRVDSCSTFLFPNSDEPSCEDAQEIQVRRAIFCKSNSVSGGVQMGFDYNYNECLSFQLGFEVVASCGLRGNRNHAFDIAQVKNAAGDALTNDLNLPSNILIRNTGAVVNFPIWFGVRWDFGSFCDPCSPC
jgi:hypothetical protein